MPDLRISQEHATILSLSLKNACCSAEKKYQDMKSMRGKNMQKQVGGRIATIS